MKRIFFDSTHRLRNGWWILIFIALVAVTRFAYKPLTQGIAALGFGDAWREPVPFLLILLVTWTCMRLRRETLAYAGFGLDRRWLAQAGAGALVGAASMLAIGALMALAGGVRFELDPARALGTLALGGYTMLFVALFEEALFRGFVFQRLVDGAGLWIAQLLVALLFAVGHWDNPGLDGATRILATLDLALAALIFGLAYYRTRSLALPVGMHFGWNFLQGHGLGFAVSGHDQSGWLQPVLLDRPDWLTGGAFGPEASAIAVLVDVGVLVALWRWRGTRAAATSPAPAHGARTAEAAA